MFKRIAVIAFAVLLVFSAYSCTKSTGPVKLKVANYLPPVHVTAKLLDEFNKEVKEKTGGDAELTQYSGGTLLDPVKMAEGVASGIADIGLSHCAYTRGRFPVMEIMELPIGIPSGYVGTHVANEFYEKVKPKEWDQYKVLLFTTSPVNIVQTVKKPVNTLSDIKGLKLRATGRIADITKTLGGVPMPLQVGELYEGLRRGLVEGAYIPYETLKSFKTGEVIKYCTESWQVGNVYTFYIIMNKGKWDSLSRKVQKVLTEVSENYLEKFAVGWNEIDVAGKEFLISQGGKTMEISDSEAQKWIEATKPVIEDYKKDMVAKGYSAGEVDEWIKFVKDRSEYWKKQEKEKNIPRPFKY